MPLLGTVTLQVETEHSQFSKLVGFNVTELLDLNLLGREAIKQLGISLDTLLEQYKDSLQCRAVFEESTPDRELHVYRGRRPHEIAPRMHQIIPQLALNQEG